MLSQTSTRSCEAETCQHQRTPPLDSDSWLLLPFMSYCRYLTGNRVGHPSGKGPAWNTSGRIWKVSIILVRDGVWLFTG